MAYFRRGISESNVMGFHFTRRFITGYGGKVAPPYSRFYMGGETDVRGFDILTISPIAYLPNRNPDSVSPARNGSAHPQSDRSRREVSLPRQRHRMSSRIISCCCPAAIYTRLFNYEYRIPIFGPVTLALFRRCRARPADSPRANSASIHDAGATVEALFPRPQSTAALILLQAHRGRVSRPVSNCRYSCRS